MTAQRVPAGAESTAIVWGAVTTSAKCVPAGSAPAGSASVLRAKSTVVARAMSGRDAGDNGRWCSSADGRLARAESRDNPRYRGRLGSPRAGL
jgi:hypothetical protein